MNLGPLMVLACSLLAQAGQEGQAASPKGPDTLSLRTALDLTLRHHPRLLNSAGAKLQAQGSYRNTRSTFYPQVRASGSLNRGGNLDLGDVSSFSDVTSGESTTSSVQAQLSQQIWDFGRSGARLAGGRSNRQATDYDALTTREDLILAAIEAYYRLWQAEAVQKVDSLALQQALAHAQQAGILEETGQGTRYQVIKADVDVENARLNQLRSANGRRLAKGNLEQALGLDLDEGVVLQDSLGSDASGEAFPDSLDPSDPDRAVRLALENRSEVSAAKWRLESARQFQLAADRAAWPALSGNAGYRYAARDPDWEWQGQWSVGLSASLPVFDGGAIRGSKEQAEGSVITARGNLAAVERSIALDARTQALNWTEADQRVLIAERLVAQAALGLELSQERYKTGAGFFLELTDAELAFSQAQIARIQALVDRRIAAASLQRALGVKDKP